MKRASMLLLLAVVVVFAARTVAADEPVTVVGVVSVTENDDWFITAVKITADNQAVYNVVLDENGKKLGAEMNGARVEVSGALVVKDNARWITVRTIKELEE